MNDFAGKRFSFRSFFSIRFSARQCTRRYAKVEAGSQSALAFPLSQANIFCDAEDPAFSKAFSLLLFIHFLHQVVRTELFFTKLFLFVPKFLLLFRIAVLHDRDSMHKSLVRSDRPAVFPRRCIADLYFFQQHFLQPSAMIGTPFSNRSFARIVRRSSRAAALPAYIFFSSIFCSRTAMIAHAVPIRMPASTSDG